MRKGNYDPEGLLDESSTGRYCRSGGFNIPGVVAQLVGMVASGLWINSMAFVGPWSKATAGSDFSVFTGLIAAGVVYWLMARRSIANENAALQK